MQGRWTKSCAMILVLGVQAMCLSAIARPASACGVRQLVDDPAPSAAAVLAKADAAIAPLKSLKAQVAIEPIGGVVATLSPAEATLAIRRDASSPVGWSFAVRGDCTGPKGQSPIASAIVGSTYRGVKPDSTVFIEQAGAGRANLVEDHVHWHLDWLLRWDSLGKAFAGDDRADYVRNAGMSKIDGVACDIIYIDYSELEDATLMDAWWHIGQADGMPRRVDWHFYSESSGDGFVRVTLRDLKADASVSDAELEVAVPEGYTLEKRVAAPVAKAPRVTPSQPGGPGVGQQAAEFSLKNPAGETVNLKDLRGKVVLLDFWATWCPPCRAAMPGIQAIHEKYQDKGVVVIGMNMNDNADPLAYMQKNKFTYKLLLNAETVAGEYGVGGIPHFVVIGPDGKIEHAGVGYGGKATDQAIEAAIERLLEKK